jgi:uncharacterized protein (TIGR00369 family)
MPIDMNTSTTPHVAELLELFARSPVQRTLGTTLDYGPDDEAIVRFPGDAAFDNALGITHGGIIATLMDTAGWFAAAACCDTWLLTADLHVQLVAPASAGPLVAEGRVTHMGNRIATARMSVTAGDGTVVALGQGTFAVGSKKRS